jgi:hypothetical protein
MKFIVICEDGEQRHELFDNPHDAADWAWWGHCCTSEHQLVPLEEEA